MFDSKKFYDKVNKCCKCSGITVTKLLKTLELSTSYGTYWKSGRVPGADVVKQIAEFFNTTTDYFLTEVEQYEPDQLLEINRIMLRLFNQLDERDKYRFIGRLEAYIEVYGGYGQQLPVASNDSDVDDKKNLVILFEKLNENDQKRFLGWLEEFVAQSQIE